MKAKKMKTATRSLPKQFKVNQQWFQDRLADKELSQRRYAKLVDMDPAAVSYMFQGKREMKMDEAIEFASIAGVPLDDVLANAGLQLPESTGKDMCQVVGSINAAGELTQGGHVDAPRRVPQPPETAGAGKTVAARFKTGASAAEVLDGWLAYYVDGIARVSVEAIGRLAVARLANHGKTVVGILRRGYSKGTYTLYPWTPGGVAMENVQLEAATPVLWLRTGV